MSGIGPVSGINSSMPPMQPAPTSGAEGTSGVQSGLSSGSVTPSQSLTTMSSSAVTASESVMYSRGPVLADEQLLGLVLLMLTLEYMQSDDEEEKKGNACSSFHRPRSLSTSRFSMARLL